MSLLREIIHTATDLFIHNQNQFASGGIFLMVIGSIGALLRKIPSKIWYWMIHQTTVTLTLTDDQRAYYWVKTWLEEQRIVKRTRHMDVFNRSNNAYTLLPAPGHHWMLFHGRVLSVIITRTDEKSLLGGNSRKETMTFTTIGRKQNVYRNLMAEIHARFITQDTKKPELYAWGSWGEWKQVYSYSPRPLDSVILPKQDKDRLVRDITDFKNSKTWYTEMGIPYRKGYLFEGPPGTGKTSLVTGLSSHFNANVYILKLSDMSDATLREAITGTEPNSFLVMEDIDCVSSGLKREKTEGTEKIVVSTNKKEAGVSLSGLLNVIDGMLSPSGAMFILTTNHAEKLDPALLRPGRIDIRLHITYATVEQKQDLYNRFFPGACPKEYLDKQDMTMAELQQILMEKKTQK